MVGSFVLLIVWDQGPSMLNQKHSIMNIIGICSLLINDMLLFMFDYYMSNTRVILNSSYVLTDY